MGYIGVKKDCANDNEVISYLRENGLRCGSRIKLELRTRMGWIEFIGFEVLGFVEGLASVLANRFQCPAFEWGEHTILGEVSAKIWNEAVKVVYPDGSSEIIEVLIHDGFLDLDLPTEKVRGLTGRIIIHGLEFKIPLEPDDIERILLIGRRGIEKIEKAINVYGYSRLLSPGALSKLLSLSLEEERKEIDWELGYVIIMRGKKITTKSIKEYISLLINTEKEEEILDIYDQAPQEYKEQIVSMINEAIKVYSEIGEKKKVEFAEKILEKIAEKREEH